MSDENEKLSEEELKALAEMVEEAVSHTRELVDLLTMSPGRTQDAIKMIIGIFPAFKDRGVTNIEGIYAMLHVAAQIAYKSGMSEGGYKQMVEHTMAVAVKADEREAEAEKEEKAKEAARNADPRVN